MSSKKEKYEKYEDLIETLRDIEEMMDGETMVLKFESIVIAVTSKGRPKVVGRKYYKFAKLVSSEGERKEIIITAKSDEDEKVIEKFLKRRRMLRFSRGGDDPSNLLWVWA